MDENLTRIVEEYEAAVEHDRQTEAFFLTFLDTIATDPGVNACTSVAAGALAQHLRGVEEPT